MTLILGIDPGSRKTGFGVIDVVGVNAEYVTSGIIRLPSGPLPERLKIIYESLSTLIDQYAPAVMAVEDIFLARDPRAALKLGQARGAAIVAGASAGLPVEEYAARSVKQAIVGNGGASKEQVQFMVTRLLKLSAAPAEDAADALAVALCHARTLNATAGMAQRVHYSRGRIKSRADIDKLRSPVK